LAFSLTLTLFLLAFGITIVPVDDYKPKATTLGAWRFGITVSDIQASFMDVTNPRVSGGAFGLPVIQIAIALHGE